MSDTHHYETDCDECEGRGYFMDDCECCDAIATVERECYSCMGTGLVPSSTYF